MGILDKFSSFEIKQEDRISQEDKEFCEKLSAVYKLSLESYVKWESDYLLQMDKIKEIADFSNKYSYITTLPYYHFKDLDVYKSIRDLHTTFVNYIYSYFESTYKIKLIHIEVNEEIEYKYDNKTERYTVRKEPLDYNVYIDNILAQIGGNSFEDRAIQEIKEDVKKIVYNSYKDTWNITIKDSVIKVENLLYWEFDKRWDLDHHLSYRSTERFNIFVRAVGFFELGHECKYFQFDILDRGIKWEEMNDLSYVQDGVIKIDNGTRNDCKLTEVKLFKNGKVDFKFKTSQMAK